MKEQNKKETNDSRKIFIQIVLYLLLALAFFSKYFVKEGEISTGAILIFIFGILSLILLTIFKKCSRILALLFISPFILIILFNLGMLYYDTLDIPKTDGFGSYVRGFPDLFDKMIHAESIIFAIAIPTILFMIYLIYLQREKSLCLKKIFRWLKKLWSKLTHSLQLNNP